MKTLIAISLMIFALQGSATATPRLLGGTCAVGKYKSGSTCRTCSSECYDCTSFSTCTACREGYAFSAGTCTFCAYYCATCSASSFQCQACTTGFYLTSESGSNTCATCPSDCYTCTSPTQCNSCIDSTYTVVNGACVSSSSISSSSSSTTTTSSSNSGAIGGIIAGGIVVAILVVIGIVLCARSQIAAGSSTLPANSGFTMGSVATNQRAPDYIPITQTQVQSPAFMPLPVQPQANYPQPPNNLPPGFS